MVLTLSVPLVDLCVTEGSGKSFDYTSKHHLELSFVACTLEQKLAHICLLPQRPKWALQSTEATQFALTFFPSPLDGLTEQLTIVKLKTLSTPNHIHSEKAC